MSDIDVERLKWDADYWDEVAPEWAAVYLHHYSKGKACFAEAHHQCAKAVIAESHNPERSPFNLAKSCWHTPVPRPTKQEWEGGLPTVDCKCQFIHPGIRSHGWQTGVIKAYFDDRVVIQSNPLIWEPNGIAVILIDSELKFRPLKSKQERQREELAGLLDQYCRGSYCGNEKAVADAILSRYNLEPKP